MPFSETIHAYARQLLQWVQSLDLPTTYVARNHQELCATLGEGVEIGGLLPVYDKDSGDVSVVTSGGRPFFHGFYVNGVLNGSFVIQHPWELIPSVIEGYAVNGELFGQLLSYGFQSISGRSGGWGVLNELTGTASVDFSVFRYLRRLTVGRHCFSKVKRVFLEAMPFLQEVEFCSCCFSETASSSSTDGWLLRSEMNEYNRYNRERFRVMDSFLWIQNCPSLISLSIAPRSFIEFSFFRISECASLKEFVIRKSKLTAVACHQFLLCDRVIFGNDTNCEIFSINGHYAFWGLPELELSAVRNLNEINVVGHFAFHKTKRVIFSRLTCLHTINIQGQGAFENVEEFRLLDLPNLQRIIITSRFCFLGRNKEYGGVMELRGLAAFSAKKSLWGWGDPLTPFCFYRQLVVGFGVVEKTVSFFVKFIKRAGFVNSVSIQYDDRAEVKKF